MAADRVKLSAPEMRDVLELRAGGLKLAAAIAQVVGRRGQPSAPAVGRHPQVTVLSEPDAMRLLVRPPLFAFHPDCDRCCMVGLCHRCLEQGATVVVDDAAKHVSFVVCSRCAREVKRMVANRDGHDGVNALGLEHLHVTPMTLSGALDDRPVARR